MIGVLAAAGAAWLGLQLTWIAMLSAFLVLWIRACWMVLS